MVLRTGFQKFSPLNLPFIVVGNINENVKELLGNLNYLFSWSFPFIPLHYNAAIFFKLLKVAPDSLKRTTRCDAINIAPPQSCWMGDILKFPLLFKMCNLKQFVWQPKFFDMAMKFSAVWNICWIVEWKPLVLPAGIQKFSPLNLAFIVFGNINENVREVLDNLNYLFSC